MSALTVVGKCGVGFLDQAGEFLEIWSWSLGGIGISMGYTAMESTPQNIHFTPRGTACYSLKMSCKFCEVSPEGCLPSLKICT